MSTVQQSVRTYFQKLGLDADIADIYLALHESGPQTMSELSRSSGVERTRLYRMVNQLLDSALVEVETRSKRAVLKPAPIANLTILISRREHELQSLKDELGLIEQVLGRNQLSSPVARVQFYQGTTGIQQMIWNETRAQSEVLSILHGPVARKVDGGFTKDWVTACNAAGLSFRSIYGDNFDPARDDSYPILAPHQLNRWQGRHISADALTIQHSTLLYDDVVAYFNWQDGAVYGMELHNKEIAASQRQLFDMLWEKAQVRLQTTQ